MNIFKVIRTIAILTMICAAVPLPLTAQSSVTSENFRADCRILKEALIELHPGLYRFISERDFEDAYARLTEIKGDRVELKQQFLSLSEFLASVKCGHTIINPYNQDEKIIRSLFVGEDKLPFTFRIVDFNIVVEHDLSGNDIVRGSTVYSINGVSADVILNQLLKYVDGDGSNYGQRLKHCELTGKGEYEFFDIYFPLLFPPVKGVYDIQFHNYGSRAGFQRENVKSISREERTKRLTKENLFGENSYDSQLKFEFVKPNVGLLTLGSFVTYKMENDWRQFIDDSFDQLIASNASALVIDIRGNSGGMTEIAERVIARLIGEPLVMNENRYVTFEKVSPELMPFLSTWDDSFYDKTGMVEKLDGRFYLLKDRPSGVEIGPQPQQFKGKVYLLTDEYNSSATFIMAQVMKENKLATLAGKSTGGNLRGITGGQILFLTLPNTGIVVDIPLITNNIDFLKQDSGLTPDITIDTYLEDFAKGNDTVLEKVLKLIGE